MEYTTSDYILISELLRKRYGCAEICIDFLGIPNAIIVHRINYENFKMMREVPTSYDDGDIEYLIKCG